MHLDDASLAWLRAAHAEIVGGAAPQAGAPAGAGGLVAAGLAVGLLAQRTPAWTEPHLALLDGLVERAAATGVGDDPPETAVLTTLVGVRRNLGGDGRWDSLVPSAARADWAALAPTTPACPQLVGVDFPAVALTQAEWLHGALLLRLAPAAPDRATWTEFRLVGAEPRLWFQTGIDGATTDVTSHAMVIRVPLIAGTLEFTPGSY